MWAQQRYNPRSKVHYWREEKKGRWNCVTTLCNMVTYGYGYNTDLQWMISRGTLMAMIAVNERCKRCVQMLGKQ